jgi:hypothetical protein|tara:strand:+ start:605 stop:1021 length:417 start_codon:yes stop_codon:yes gene_type:complete
MADINGVELSYATKDEYDFEGGEYNDGEVQTAMQNNMNGKWTKENFEEFHKNNPEIYTLFIKFTNMVIERKRKYYSAKAIFHRIRWESMISSDTHQLLGDYKIDDGWISHYARMFMDDFPQHQGFFQTRDRKNSYHKN